MRFPFQRAFAAFFAIDFRRAAESFAARAFPPFAPPRRPNATAAGFFSRVMRARIAWASRFGSVLERLGMEQVSHGASLYRRSKQAGV